MLVLFLQGHLEARDHRPEYFQQLGDSIMLFLFIDDFEEDMLDALTYVATKWHISSIHTMNESLQVIPFAWILRVE